MASFEARLGVSMGPPTGGGNFVDVSDTCACADDLPTLSAAYADFDHDGRIDFAVGNRAEGTRVHRNETDIGDHNWLAVELVGGPGMNRDAVGGRVYVETNGGRTLMAEVKSGSSTSSQNSLRLHFGLGLERIEQVYVRWPNGLYEQPEAPEDNTLWVHTYPGG